MLRKIGEVIWDWLILIWLIIRVKFYFPKEVFVFSPELGYNRHHD